MPKILDDPNKETDVCHTPLEEKRRSVMRLRNVSFGFFRVATEPIPREVCSSCSKDITGVPHTIVDGKRFCKSCY